jgi:hypothetical protein
VTPSTRDGTIDQEDPAAMLLDSFSGGKNEMTASDETHQVFARMLRRYRETAL